MLSSAISATVATPTPVAAPACSAAASDLAPRAGQELGVLEAVGDRLGVEDHGGRHDGARPGPAAGLVDAADRRGSLGLEDEVGKVVDGRRHGPGG
jgi:hypothetical protein